MPAAGGMVLAARRQAVVAFRAGRLLWLA